MPFPIHLCPALPLSSRKVLFAVLVPPSCTTHRSTPRTTLFQRSAFSTLGLPLRTMNSLRSVAARAAPTVEMFPSTSGGRAVGSQPLTHPRHDAPRAVSCQKWSISLSRVSSPSRSAHTYAGASILALRKPNGSLRPIAIGETIRRLTSKIAVDLITDRARSVPAGRQDTGWVRSNNPCHTPVVSPPPLQPGQGCPLVGRLRCVQHGAPFPFPFDPAMVDCCYRHESTLFTGSGGVAPQVIASAREVQQGDPLGPVLFALAIHPVIKKARQVTETSRAPFSSMTG